MASHPITIGSALLLEISLRISAFLSDSAVIAFCSTSTAEMNAEMAEFILEHHLTIGSPTAKELFKVTFIDSFARLRL